MSEYPCGNRKIWFPFQPYPSQLKFMETAFTALDNGGLAVLEAPTGSGKSLCLLTSTLTWLSDIHEGRSTITYPPPSMTTDPNGGGDGETAEKKQEVPDFVLQWERSKGRERLYTALQSKREMWSSSARRNTVKRAFYRKRARDDTKEAEDGTNPNSGGSIEWEENDETMLQSAAACGILRDDDDVPPYDVPKIIYASRTHSQLTQLIEELKKTKFWGSPSVKIVHLGSRSHQCINADAIGYAKGSSEALTEKCTELGPDCPYRAPGRVTGLSNALTKRPHTMSEIEDLGKLNKACPYFATREALPTVQVVLVPYNTLLDAGARSQVGLELMGSVVVIDEAHNVMSAASGVLNVELNPAALASVVGAIDQYLIDKKQKLLSRTKGRLYDVRTVLDRIYQGIATVQHVTDVKTIACNTFIQDCQISHYNLFALQEFMVDQGVDTRLGDSVCGAVRVCVKLLYAFASDKGDSLLVVQPAGSMIKVCALAASKSFAAIVEESLSVLLIGGTMPPLEILKAELMPCVVHKSLSYVSLPHVVPQANVYATVCTSGPTEHLFRFTYANKQIPGNDRLMCHEGGRVVANLCNIVPKGLIVFFTSYTHLESTIQVWRDEGILTQIEKRKEVLWERHGQDCEPLLRDYKRVVDKRPDGAVLCGVMGGKLAEGINFADEYGRCVVMVGLPYPNPNDAELNARYEYISARSGIDALTKQAYTDSLCITTVNQTIGRVIRHRGDYAAMVFLDERMMQDRLQKLLPKWVRDSLATPSAKTPPPSFIEAFRGLRDFFQSKTPLKK